MEVFTAFFESLNSVQKLSWIVGCLGLFWLLEGAYPLVQFNYKKWKHARTNLVLLGTTILINVLFGIATAALLAITSKYEFGVLNWVKLPDWAALLLAIMLLDFVAQYLVHYMLHRVKFMWRFHMVHHSDTTVDVTTGTRHHPGDYMFRELFALVAILLGGIPFGYYMFYRIATVLFTYLSHANIYLPNWLDRGLSFIFISPNMHKFHHHFERPWTDSNFGNIFSLWDRICGTFVYEDPRKVRYGLDVLEDKYSADLGYQLRVPFDKSIKTDD
jgi:sterol desaturase/sphingolipid hydroxylase (fatty acid hydroxylase superfamily)